MTLLGNPAATWSMLTPTTLEPVASSLMHFPPASRRWVEDALHHLGGITSWSNSATHMSLICADAGALLS